MAIGGRTRRNHPHRLPWRHALALAAAVALAGPAVAQSGATPAPDALRRAPPEIDQSRPGGDPAAPRPDRSGGGPTGNDIVDDSQGGGIGRSVIRPPMSVDPGIQRSVPDPTPGTTPVIPPPGTPGGDSTVVPR
jgi:hypothetical protein